MGKLRRYGSLGRWAAAWTGRASVVVVLVLFWPLAPASAVPSLQVVFTNPDYQTLAVDHAGVAYGAPSGSLTEVWRSLDEGRTWAQRFVFPSNYRLHYITPLGSGTLLAGIDTGTWQIFRSDDGAATWTPVLSLPVTPCFYTTLTPDSITEGDGYVFLGTYNDCPDGANTNYIYRSADDGRTWSVVATSTTHRHVHSIHFDPGSHALYALYGDSLGAIERSTNDGVSWTPICTDYSNCVAVDGAFGSGFVLYGTDTPFQQNAIVRLDLASNATSRILDLPRVSYSAYALGSGRFLIGQVHEQGSAVGDGQVHLYASDDNGQSFSDVYDAPFSGNGPDRMMVQFSYPNGDFPIQFDWSGTTVAHLASSGTPPAPVNTSPPSISGSAQQGQSLSASTGAWTNSPTGYAYQWQDCDSGGANCIPIAAATGASYLLAAADVGHTIRVQVTASNGGGSGSATSAQSGVVVASSSQVLAAGAAATNLPTESSWPGAQNPPYICCWNQQGQYVTFTFTVAAGSTGLALRYSAGAGVASRKIELDGAVFVASQTFAATANWSTWASVSLNATLTAGTHTLKIWFDSTAGSAQWINLDNLTITQAGSPPAPPVNTSPPSISGSAQQGQTLSASTGTWTNSPTGYTYQWQDCDSGGANCIPIVAAAGATYLLAAADVGHTVRVQVTASNGGGSSSPAGSAATAVVVAAPSAPVNTSPPAISGSAQQGQSLSASTGAWTNSPTGYAYQWQDCDSGGANCIPIAAATGASYLLAAADVGHTIRVQVTASNGGGSGSATSAQSGVVVASSSQVLAAGAAATNLPTESSWPGAQNPPYICCWNQQGQYVTFTFTVAAGSTGLALRYSAGAGVASRKIELDGAVFVASQTFAATANWSTWASVSLNATLTAGTHTLKIWFDSTAGSAQWINLDNLTITQAGSPPPPSLTVALGYADGASGLDPWSGSAGTVFIGEAGQCCLTHGSDNGSAGYDAGAIEVSNPGLSSVTLSAVTVDFGGGSVPSHFDLWGTSGGLPVSVAPGGNVVLTMTSAFNFDTSDLLGEACHLNSGVVPVVHVTVNGVTTDYRDDRQILNSDGADLASCPGDVSERVPFTTVVAGDQPAGGPVNDVAPSLTGVAVQGRVLSGFAGGWNASPPPALSLQWARCDSSGANCAAIGGATSPTYRPVAADVGATLRLQVTASNASGSLGVSSAPTTTIQAGPAVGQLGDTSTGFTSVFVTSGSGELDSTFTAAESGTSTYFEFFARGASNDQVFTPRVYSVVSGQKGNLLASGAAVTVLKGTDGRWYVSSLAGVSLTAGSQYVLALSPSAVFNGTYVGAESNGQLSLFVDYAPAAGSPPVNTGLPVISGTAQQGQSLSASTGAWTNSPTGYAYQWQDCDSGGANCTPIAAASGASYLLAAGDVGHTIRVAVTASNGGGSSGPAVSAATAVVAAAPSAPVNTSPPSISGTARQGQTLSASTGAWTNSPTGYAYQWQDCNSGGAGCVAIGGATSSSYLLAAADVGHTIRVAVTASNGGGSSSPASSAATAVVVAAPPVNTGLPSISGTARQGQTLSASTGAWTNSPTGYAYQWQDCNSGGTGCTSIAGATGASYLLAAADVGHRIRVRVTASNGGGSSSPASSAATAVVAAASSAPVNTSPPSISGSAQQGQTLSASTGAWTNSPTGYAYQWQDCDSGGNSCVAIGGAISSSYLLAAADVGHTIRVRVTASNGGGSGSATSVQTGVVQASSSQVLAAGKAATNLPTESTWPGAQNPPYICCWNQQGQYVTFTFTVAAGSTGLALRYSAGAGVASRKIELDGAVFVAKQTFAATANWSTWASVSLNATLTAGTHTLKIWFDSTAGSAQWINLDNLTVTGP